MRTIARYLLFLLLVPVELTGQGASMASIPQSGKPSPSSPISPATREAWGRSVEKLKSSCSSGAKAATAESTATLLQNLLVSNVPLTDQQKERITRRLTKVEEACRQSKSPKPKAPSSAGDARGQQRERRSGKASDTTAVSVTSSGEIVWESDKTAEGKTRSDEGGNQGTNRETPVNVADWLRDSEREISLVYWDSGAATQLGSPGLTLHQAGYVFEDRLEKLNSSIATLPGPKSSSLPSTILTGLENARALSAVPIAASSTELQARLRTLDFLQKNPSLLTSPDRILALDELMQGLGRQAQYAHRYNQPLVAVSIKTVTPDKKEINGYTIYFAWKSDYELNQYDRQPFDTVSSPARRDLGPFRYYLWAEKQGESPTAPQLFDFGDPLEKERKLEIVILPKAQP